MYWAFDVGNRSIDVRIEMSYCVYKHTFPNGKVYIGITSRKPHRRWNNGKGYLNKNKNNEYTQPSMARAILKYGWDNVSHDILFQKLSKEEAEQKEIELINKYHSNNIEFGYNIANGGNSIGSVSDETKAKISKIHKGKHLSDEHKKKISEFNTGKKRSEETKEKLRGENNPFYGKRHSEETKKRLSELAKERVISEETRKKMSDSRKGQKRSEETRRKISESKLGKKRPDLSERNKTCGTPIRCVESDAVYYGQKEAARQTGIPQSSIWKCLYGKQKTAGGYHWEFVEDNNVEVM